MLCFVTFTFFPPRSCVCFGYRYNAFFCVEFHASSIGHLVHKMSSTWAKMIELSDIQPLFTDINLQNIRIPEATNQSKLESYTESLSDESIHCGDGRTN